jgi:hypothetical protein
LGKASEDGEGIWVKDMCEDGGIQVCESADVDETLDCNGLVVIYDISEIGCCWVKKWQGKTES